MTYLQNQSIRALSALQYRWTQLKEDERGEGMVSFLIVAVGVAAIALIVLGIFESKSTAKINDLDLGSPANP